MGNKVTFDYSKTAPFIRDDEVELMKKTGCGCKGSSGWKKRRRQ